MSTKTNKAADAAVWVYWAYAAGKTLVMVITMIRRKEDLLGTFLP